MKRILIVEDDSIACEFYKKVFEKPELFEVACAHNGDSGFDLLQTFKPDIVFLDMEMPNSNGFDFLNQYCSSNCNDVKIIVVSAGMPNYSKDQREFVNQNTTHAYMKPISPEALLKEVEF